MVDTQNNKSDLRKLKQRLMCEQSIKLLRENGVPCEKFSNTHYRLEGYVDFWPTTGKWYDKPNKKKGYGVHNLLKHLGASKQ